MVDIFLIFWKVSFNIGVLAILLTPQGLSWMATSSEHRSALGGLELRNSDMQFSHLAH